jgi:alanine racemase
MDMITVDLTPVPGAGIGSEVTLWGHGPAPAGAAAGAAHPVLPIDEIAHAAGTIGYELMCAVAPRVAKLTADTGAIPPYHRLG